MQENGKFLFIYKIFFKIFYFLKYFIFRASPPTTLYLMHRLIEDPEAREELLAHIDWLIIPMDNPDGT
jgi:hypothetical protein